MKKWELILAFVMLLILLFVLKSFFTIRTENLQVFILDSIHNKEATINF